MRVRVLSWVSCITECPLNWMLWVISTTSGCLSTFIDWLVLTSTLDLQYEILELLLYFLFIQVLISIFGLPQISMEIERESIFSFICKSGKLPCTYWAFVWMQWSKSLSHWILWMVHLTQLGAPLPKTLSIIMVTDDGKESFFHL